MGVNKLALPPKRLWHRNAKNIVGLGTMLEKEKMVVFFQQKKTYLFFSFLFSKN
jgi:hypothetical protein